MATHPDEQPASPESQPRGGGIGAGALATAGLGLIALAILLWFLYPRFSGTGPPATEQAPGTVIAALITATPPPAETATRAPTRSISLVETSVPPSPTPMPALPTATLPAKVQAGIYAKVAGTGSGGLRFRSGPGLDFITWRILPEGEILKVTGGPREADGAVWWRALDKTGLVGWAAEQYLVPAEPPAWTPEPERTPNIRKMTPSPGG